MALKHHVYPLFSEPLFRTNLGGVITDEHIAYIRNLKMVPNRENLISENLYIFEEPELAAIRDAAQEALDLYAGHVLGISQKLYITQSWALTNMPGIGMHSHAHANSVVSGTLYYCEMPKPAPKVIFDRHRSYQQLQLVPEPGRVNLYNTLKNAVVPEAYDMVLFSSGMLHMVEENQSNQPRHAIAFNSFVKGKLGDYRDVSELVL